MLPDPTFVDSADVLLVESTYGDRTHEEDDGGKLLAGIINETIERRGKVVIPAFALGRVEELLYWVSLLEERRQIPELPVYVDSPMSASVLAEYRRRMGELDPDVSRYAVSKGEHAASERRAVAFATAKLTVLSSIRESRDVQESNEPAIVISSSGMATGGRVLHHLARVLPDPRNTVLFAGYQSVGTRGRSLKDGAKMVRIHGQEIPVRAEIAALESMSAHADANEILTLAAAFQTAAGADLSGARRARTDGHAARAHRARARLDRADAGTRRKSARSEFCNRVPAAGRHSTIVGRNHHLWNASSCSNRSTMPRSCSTTRTASNRCPLDQKILIWHLYQAALAGRDIYYDQRYRHSLEMRELLEGILTQSRRRRSAGSSRKSAATPSCSGSTRVRTTT